MVESSGCSGTGVDRSEAADPRWPEDERHRRKKRSVGERTRAWKTDGTPRRTHRARLNFAGGGSKQLAPRRSRTVRPVRPPLVDDCAPTIFYGRQRWMAAARRSFKKTTGWTDG